jgi:hypothetical protein
MCKRCETYGTSCNYDAGHVAFQPLARRDRYFHTLQPPPCSEKRLILGTINCTSNLQGTNSSQIHGGDEFSFEDLELAQKFHMRTILTLGIAQGNRVYQDAYTKLVYCVRQLRLLILPAANKFSILSYYILW